MTRAAERRGMWPSGRDNGRSAAGCRGPAAAPKARPFPIRGAGNGNLSRLAACRSYSGSASISAKPVEQQFHLVRIARLLLKLLFINFGPKVGARGGAWLGDATSQRRTVHLNLVRVARKSSVQHSSKRGRHVIDVRSAEQRWDQSEGRRDAVHLERMTSGRQIRRHQMSCARCHLGVGRHPADGLLSLRHLRT